MIGDRTYNEDVYTPKPGGLVNWNVWGPAGAKEVLDKEEYKQWLEEHPDRAYVVNFANGACARIRSGSPLWKTMKQIASQYEVKVFMVTLKGGFVSWDGERGSLGVFDAISIRVKKES